MKAFSVFIDLCFFGIVAIGIIFFLDLIINLF